MAESMRSGNLPIRVIPTPMTATSSYEISFLLNGYFQELNHGGATHETLNFRLPNPSYSERLK